MTLPLLRLELRVALHAGGYNFTHRLDDAAWLENRRRMAAVMRFSSVPLGMGRALACSLASLIFSGRGVA